MSVSGLDTASSPESRQQGPPGTSCRGWVMVMMLWELVLLWVLPSTTWVQAVQSAAVEQIHLAFSPAGDDGYPSGVVVSWVTQIPTDSVVYYGLRPDDLVHRTEGVLPAARYSNVPGATWNHHVVLVGLMPGTRYYYMCGDDGFGLSTVRDFVTAKNHKQVAMQEGEEEEQPLFRVVVFGDMGLHNSDATKKTLASMVDEGAYDFIWHIGDIAYCDDAFMVWPFLDFKYELWYNAYQNSVEPFASRVPVMVLPGNHEAECRSPYCQTHKDTLASLGNFSAYNTRFSMPSQSSGGALSMWYSFNYGNVHFISINTETDYPDAPNDKFTRGGVGNGGFGDQLAWLERDLKQAEADRDIRPWVLVAGHRPIYTAQQYTEDDESSNKGGVTGYCLPLQQAFEDLFYEYQVDLYFAGHVHSYERHWPVYSGVPFKSYQDPPFPVHIISGAAGNIEGLSTYPGDPLPPWNVLRMNETYGFGILEVTNSTELSWSYVDSETGKVLDQFVLRKHDTRKRRRW